LVPILDFCNFPPFAGVGHGCHFFFVIVCLISRFGLDIYTLPLPIESLFHPSSPILPVCPVSSQNSFTPRFSCFRICRITSAFASFCSPPVKVLPGVFLYFFLKALVLRSLLDLGRPGRSFFILLSAALEGRSFAFSFVLPGLFFCDLSSGLFRSLLLCSSL